MSQSKTQVIDDLWKKYGASEKASKIQSEAAAIIGEAVSASSVNQRKKALGLTQGNGRGRPPKDGKPRAEKAAKSPKAKPEVPVAVSSPAITMVKPSPVTSLVDGVAANVTSAVNALASVLEPVQFVPAGEAAHLRLSDLGGFVLNVIARRSIDEGDNRKNVAAALDEIKATLGV